MSVRFCDICKKNEARIFLEQEGWFCLECHNERMLVAGGDKNTYNYPKSIIVMEPSGTVHPFKLEHVILGSIVSWDAYEQDGNYHFREISDISDNGSVAARRFIQKIVDGVCTKTLDVSDDPVSNLLQRGNKTYSLKNKGTINIIEDESHSFEVAFEIDGQIFSSEEFGKLLGAHPGFTMQYLIHDASSPLLKEDEYLVPTKISKASLMEELEEAVNIHGDGRFISYKDVLAFDSAVYPIMDKLKVLMEFGEEAMEEALETGKDMIRLFLEIETDDDYFPEYHLQHIGSLVNPTGSDEEVAQLIASFYDR